MSKKKLQLKHDAIDPEEATRIETWKRNGWDGRPETKGGRDVMLKCGHSYFVGWGIAKVKYCYECEYETIKK